MNTAILMLAMCVSDPMGDKFIIDHLAWKDGLVANVEFFDRHQWEQEMAEPRAHRLILQALLPDETETRREKAVKEELKKKWQEIHRRKFNQI